MDVKIALVGFPETATGFRLSGVVDTRIIVEGDEERMKADTLVALRELMKKEEMGVIIVNETLADLARDELEELHRPGSVYPILVEVPSKNGTPEGREDPVKTLIRRATGVEEL